MTEKLLQNKKTVECIVDGMGLFDDEVAELVADKENDTIIKLGIVV